MARGVLRVYLGAAPGVGKTVAMLEEGNRRAQRGTDVVVALVEFHGRSLTRWTCPGLQAGAMPVVARAVDMSGVVARALDGLGAAADAVTVSAPLDLPEVTADAGLIERVVANLVENALRFSAADSPPMISASGYGDRVEIRVVDRGRGLDAEAKDRMFVPFQRLGDNSSSTGVGLGLALARGLTEAMGGELAPEDTPGGGLTMVSSRPAVTQAEHPAPAAVLR